MYQLLKYFVIVLFILVSENTMPSSVYKRNPGKEQRLQKIAAKKLSIAPWDFTEWRHTGKIALDSIKVETNQKNINLYFSPQFTHIPIRQDLIDKLKGDIRKSLGKRFYGYSLKIITRNKLVETFIPNYYRQGAINADTLRKTILESETSIVRRASQNQYKNGLTNRHIAMWPGHGWYYEQNLDRWEWQRARLFQTVEDMFPYTIIRNYLAPMLENAGAYVFIPRERCVQLNEIIVDNDTSTGNSELVIINGSFNWETVKTSGFKYKNVLFDGENPFEHGTHLQVKSGGEIHAILRYIPEIPEDGEYGVYISWGESGQNLENIICKVNYSGGNEDFIINQKMGNSTWVYLGTYHFLKGKNAKNGSLELLSNNEKEGYITADAVRFGGGMGNVARGTNDSTPLINLYSKNKQVNKNNNNYKISQRPRFMEGARYFLQYSGMPDSTVYNISKGKKDYNDDYMSRGEWVNYLMGNPNGPTGNPDAKGLGIPIDLALSFHTDAGITNNDSVIGTLAIYSTKQNSGFFPNGKSRLASRDLSDLIQTQLVDDIRIKYNNKWTRRGLWDREYSEAWRPNTPAMLLELLSHQNLADMQFGLDPRFQFDISRSIYKGMLRFIKGEAAIVQPLAPIKMKINFIEGKKIKISWEPGIDPIDPSAMPKSYKVYCQFDNNGFDTGILTNNEYLELELETWSDIYSFRVTAVNDGGESFPGETLSVSIIKDQEPKVLIVNSFDRISAPLIFDIGKKAGIEWWNDEGVPLGIDFSKTGNQYDYNRNSKWLDDDNPGWGASYANMEGKGISGNTFNYTNIHGRAFRDAGYSFVSMSNESFVSSSETDLNKFAVIDMIFGEQRSISNFLNKEKKEFRVFTPELIEVLGQFAKNNGKLIISGAYIGTDMIENNDSLAIKFADNILGYKWRTNNSTNAGMVTATNEASQFFTQTLDFNTFDNSGIYKVEAPDAIEPSSVNSKRLYLYSTNNTTAAVLFNGDNKAVSFGFPLESIVKKEQLTDLIRDIMIFFKN